MEEKIRVYYDMTLWEEITIDKFDELKDKCGKFATMLKGLGIQSFNIRTSDNRVLEEQQPTGEQTEQPSTN